MLLTAPLTAAPPSSQPAATCGVHTLSWLRSDSLISPHLLKPSTTPHACPCTCTALALFAVGDNIYLNSNIYRIKKISLLFTEMIAVDGEVS